MKLFPLIISLPALLSFPAPSESRISKPWNISRLIEDDTQGVEKHRDLTTCSGALKSYFYEASIEMDSQTELNCDDDELVEIGTVVNGAFDNLFSSQVSAVKLETGICTAIEEPISTSHNYDNWRRSLPTYNYPNWSGGGRCLLCPHDNGDRRLERGLAANTAFLISEEAQTTAQLESQIVASSSFDEVKAALEAKLDSFVTETVQNAFVNTPGSCLYKAETVSFRVTMTQVEESAANQAKACVV